MKTIVYKKFILFMPSLIYHQTIIYIDQLSDVSTLDLSVLLYDLLLKVRLLIFNKTFIQYSIHREQDRQLGLTFPLYLYLYPQKQDRQLGLTLPLFIENRTGSQVLPSLYISTSIHRNITGSQVLPSLYISTSIHRNRTGSWVLPSLYISTSIYLPYKFI